MVVVDPTAFLRKPLPVGANPDTINVVSYGAATVLMA